MHHHGAGLRAILATEGLDLEAQAAVLDGVVGSPASAPHLSSSERALLAYADVLTLTPWAVTRALVDELRAAGYTDRAIHDACAIVGYFAFVNRIADGLGVDLERTPTA